MSKSPYRQGELEMRRVLTALKKRAGKPTPSLAELATELGFKVVTVQWYVTRLIAEGRVAKRGIGRGRVFVFNDGTETLPQYPQKKRVTEATARDIVSDHELMETIRKFHAARGRTVTFKNAPGGGFLSDIPVQTAVKR